MIIKNNQITVVIPARNCRGTLARCLSVLSAREETANMIVVDDGSDDGTDRMVREKWPSAVLLRVPVHTGFAHAANLGLRLVRTDYALLLRPELRPGRNCVRRLLEALESGSARGNKIFCAVPQRLPEKAAKDPEDPGSTGKIKRARNRKASAKRARRGRPDGLLAVPDGCALYRMKTLEETGWFDERHFDGLEAMDLTLRAARLGARTVRVPGAFVRPWAPPLLDGNDGCDGHDRDENELGLRTDTFRRQLAAGNGIYILYKHVSAAQKLLCLPVIAAETAAQKASFAGRGESDAWKMARVRGRALCSLEQERRAALDSGVSVWPESLPDASFLGMEEAADRIYPLYLAEKEPPSLSGLPAWLKLQAAIFLSMPEMLRAMR